MANTDKQQPDFSKDPDHQQSSALSSMARSSQTISRNIEDLQTGMRIDFDQKLAELSDLLARFKAMVVTPQNDPLANAANDDAENSDSNSLDVSSVEASLVKDTTQTSAIRNGSTRDDTDSEKVDVPQVNSTITNPASDYPAPVSSVNRFAPEPARFESGLYKLNSQLYRFRLELDQELEFREEQLHTHFHQESELSMVLQKISDQAREKNPDN